MAVWSKGYTAFCMYVDWFLQCQHSIQLFFAKII